MVYDFTIDDLTPRPGGASFFDQSLGLRIWIGPGYKIYDARGVRIYWVKWCDTDTGEVVRYDRDLQQNRFVWDAATGRIREVRERRPAPLRVVEMKPGEQYLP